MNRRTFLQSMSAAFCSSVLAGTVDCRHERHSIDYSQFVDEDQLWSRRYDLSHPFSVDGSIYATDGRVVITHPGEWRGTSEGRVPDVTQLWWDEFDRSGWKPLGRPHNERHPDGASCPICRGKWLIGPTATCKRCDGLGWMLQDFGRAVTDCDCYEGKVGVKCPAGCDRGLVDYREQIDGCGFCPDYMARLRTLGDLEYRRIDVDHGVIPSLVGLLLVRAAGNVRGILCGMAD